MATDPPPQSKRQKLVSNSNGDHISIYEHSEQQCLIEVAGSIPLPPNKRVSALTAGIFSLQNMQPTSTITEVIPSPDKDKAPNAKTFTPKSDSSGGNLEPVIIVGTESGDILLINNNEASQNRFYTK